MFCVCHDDADVYDFADDVLKKVHLNSIVPLIRSWQVMIWDFVGGSWPIGIEGTN